MTGNGIKNKLLKALKIGSLIISALFMPTVQRTIREIISLEYARQKHIGDISSNPLVSVRIPTINRSSLLIERAIASVLSQTYKNKEIVVVGDHCTDDTSEKLKGKKVIWYNLPERNSYEKELLKDPKIRWFMGPVRATNKATELCSGDWIAHLDDDDTWTNDHIEELLKFAIKGNYELVYGDYEEERYGVKKVVENGCQTWLYRKYVADIFKYDSNCWKKSWDRVSDIDVFKRMENAGVRIGHLKKVMAYVLPRPGEQTIGLQAYLKK